MDGWKPANSPLLLLIPQSGILKQLIGGSSPCRALVKELPSTVLTYEWCKGCAKRTIQDAFICWVLGSYTWHPFPFPPNYLEIVFQYEPMFSSFHPSKQTENIQLDDSNRTLAHDGAPSSVYLLPRCQKLLIYVHARQDHILIDYSKCNDFAHVMLSIIWMFIWDGPDFVLAQKINKTETDSTQDRLLFHDVRWRGFNLNCVMNSYLMLPSIFLC